MAASVDDYTTSQIFTKVQKSRLNRTAFHFLGLTSRNFVGKLPALAPNLGVVLIKIIRSYRF